jgi:hypothetical protein
MNGRVSKGKPPNPAKSPPKSQKPPPPAPLPAENEDLYDAGDICAPEPERDDEQLM